MNFISDNKLDFGLLKRSLEVPQIFEKSTHKFWDDEYVSEQMLKFHLNPNIEAASKTNQTIRSEAGFIIKSTAMNAGNAVLDLGCGPGLYVKEFAKTGAMVTGIDLSARSINYAKDTIKPVFHNTHFINTNYLDIDFKETFDIATLIFYDFCALSTTEQSLLLGKIRTALTDNGVFIFDVVTENKKTAVSTHISVCEEGGLWSSKPYIEILNTHLYDTPKTEGLQYVIIDEDGIARIIRIYHRLFSLSELTAMLKANGFKIKNVYSNLKGEVLHQNSETYGIIAAKA